MTNFCAASRKNVTLFLTRTADWGQRTANTVHCALCFGLKFAAAFQHQAPLTLCANLPNDPHGAHPMKPNWGASSRLANRRSSLAARPFALATTIGSLETGTQKEEKNTHSPAA